MKVLRLLIVDDHPLFRRGLRDVLALEEGLEVVAEAAQGQAALEVMRSLQPDIALVDVNLPDINGHEIVRLAHQEKLPTRIVLLTAYDDIAQQRQALAEGAAAYISKEVPPGWLIQVVREVAAGRYVLNRRVMSDAERVRWLEENAVATPLSPREMEVLRLVTYGMGNRAIAEALGISEQTVKNHVTAILRKLQVGDRTQAAVYALQRGWVRLD